MDDYIFYKTYKCLQHSNVTHIGTAIELN